jgi:hypothetical protein
MRLLAKPKDETETYYSNLGETIVRDAKKIAGSLIDFAMNLSKKSEDAARLVACIFAYLTLLSAKDNQYRSMERCFLLQPHATQLLTIFRGLGLDNESGMQNNLVQMKTGEGKSFPLGVIAAFMALLNYQAKTVCYSDYLSKRDYKAFESLFIALNIANLIQYQTIGNLVFTELRRKSKAPKGTQLPDLPDILEVFQLYMTGKASEFKSSETPSERRILLLDEVDVFFGKDFYGEFREVLQIFQSEEIRSVLWHLYENRNDYLSRSKEKSSRNELAGILMKTALVSSVLKKYEHVRPFMKGILIKMLFDLQQFPGDSIHHKCVLVTKKEKHYIGYLDSETDEVSTNTVWSYCTAFATFYYAENLKLNKFEIYDNHGLEGIRMGMTFVCGRILYSELPKYFTRILGLSGTLHNLCDGENQILNDYNFTRRTYIPSTFAKKEVKETGKTICCLGTAVMKFESILCEIEEVLTNERPILIIFNTLEKLKAFKTYLDVHAKGKVSRVQTLEDKYNHSEKDAAIARAMQPGMVTLMTRKFGRGIDFICRIKSINLMGGVHLILAFFPETLSEEIQILGRTGRQDYNGTFRKIYDLEDVKPFLEEKDEASLRNKVAEKKPVDDLLAECRKKSNAKRYNALIDKRKENYKHHEATLTLARAVTAQGIFSNTKVIRDIIVEFNQNYFGIFEDVPSEKQTVNYQME